MRAYVWRERDRDEKRGRERGGKRTFFPHSAFPFTSTKRLKCFNRNVRKDENRKIEFRRPWLWKGPILLCSVLLYICKFLHSSYGHMKTASWEAGVDKDITALTFIVVYADFQQWTGRRKVQVRRRKRQTIRKTRINKKQPLTRSDVIITILKCCS